MIRCIKCLQDNVLCNYDTGLWIDVFCDFMSKNIVIILVVAEGVSVNPLSDSFHLRNLVIWCKLHLQLRLWLFRLCQLERVVQMKKMIEYKLLFKTLKVRHNWLYDIFKLLIFVGRFLTLVIPYFPNERSRNCL